MKNYSFINAQDFSNFKLEVKENFKVSEEVIKNNESDLYFYYLKIQEYVNFNKSEKYYNEIIESVKELVH